MGRLGPLGRLERSRVAVAMRASGHDTRIPGALAVLKTLLVSLIGFAVAAPAVPANAFVAQVATSIPAAAIEDDAQFREAVYTAIQGVIKRAIAFTPSLVELQSAKVVGDRLFLLLLVADPEGEETLKTFEAAERGSN